MLTPVGLLPIAVAGFDIQQLIKGAQDMEKATGTDVPFTQNIAARYAAIRQALYSEAGKKIEIWQTSNQSSILWLNGGSNSMEKAKGKDQKGIVAGVATKIAELGLNIDDISQTVLDEYFTMMAVVSSDEKQDFTYLRNEFEAFGQTLNVKINIQSAAIFEAMYNI